MVYGCHRAPVKGADLIIFDEPARGVDVGAIVEIHELIQQFADESEAVVVISSYLPEIMALSDRFLVSRQGKVVEEFSALEATEEKITYAAVHQTATFYRLTFTTGSLGTSGTTCFIQSAYEDIRV
jgi:ABC-type sugar transport system ATPase subunit